MSRALQRQLRFLKSLNDAMENPRWWIAHPEFGRVFDFSGWLDHRLRRKYGDVRCPAMRGYHRRIRSRRGKAWRNRRRAS